MRILIAEDDAISRRALEASLGKWGHDVMAIDDGLQAYQLLQQDDAPRLAILDWMMPGMDGLQICRELRKQTDKPYIYLILLTARSRKEDLIEGLEAGADDYLMKPFDILELQARLNVGQRILDLQDRLLAALELQREQATYDPLTGTRNRWAVLDILQRELARARREQIPVGLIMADLDHFKKVNDTYGHLAGDAVLREAAQRMRDSTRAYDAIGRYGGEEFLIVLPGCDRQRTAVIAERIRECIATRPVPVPEQNLSITISLGAVSSGDFDKLDAESLLKYADEALYQAKRAGRNRVEMAETPARRDSPSRPN